jgi:hypothetical protein
MKIKKDENLSITHKYTFGIAKKIGDKASQDIIDYLIKLFKTDEVFGHLEFSGALSTILKVNSVIFFHLTEFAHFIGTHFPDCENNRDELFEEAIEGIREIAKLEKPNKKEYINGIKKVEVKK